MILKHLPSLFHLLPDWRQKTPQGSDPRKSPSERMSSEACWAEASSQLDAVFSDALCLTGSEDAAADLVVEAYRRTFHDWFWEPRPAVAARPQTHDLLAGLYRNLYTAFCDGVLACAAPPEASKKEQL